MAADAEGQARQPGPLPPGPQHALQLLGPPAPAPDAAAAAAAAVQTAAAHRAAVDLVVLRAVAQLLQAAGADSADLQAAAQLLQATGAAPGDAATDFAALRLPRMPPAADPAAVAAHRAAIAAGKQPATDAAPDPAWTGLGMSPADAPLAAAALRG